MATQTLNQITGMPKLPLSSGLLETKQKTPKGYVGGAELGPAYEELRGAEAQAEQKVGEADINIEKAKREEKATEAEKRLALIEQQGKELRELPERKTVQELRGQMEESAFVPTKETFQDLTAMFTLMGVIGMVMGKGNAQLGMSAMNGMLEGHQKGRADLYKKEKDIFDKNFKVLQQKITTAEKALEEAIKLKSVDKEAGEQKILMEIYKSESPFLKAVYEKQGAIGVLNNIKGVRKDIDHVSDLQNKLQKVADDRQARKDMLQMRLGGGTAPAGPNVTSDIESSAQAIANYAQKPPGLRDKTRPQIMARVREINPQYNEMDYGQRDLAMRNYTNPNGTGAKQLQAFTTVAGHLESLEVLGEALKNKDTQLVNQALNYIAVQTGSPEVTNFNAAKQAVAGEVVKAITGTAGALADRKEAEQIFSEVKSPEQLQGAIDTVKELIYSRLDTTRAHYESATGRHDFETRLPDIVKRTFVEKKRPTSAPAPAPQPSTSTKPANIPADAKLASDGYYYSPDPTRPGKYIRH